MNIIEKPLNRKERRAAAHANRKAAYKKERADARAAVAHTAIQTRAVGSTINASIDQPPSETPHIPSVDSYNGGPRTESGKQISSQNALKHGSCSLSILIHANESLDDFLALEKRWFQSYQVDPNNPETLAEADLIKAAVRAEWFYLRAERNFAEYDHQINHFYQLPSQWEDYAHKTLARFLRYRTANLNLLNKSRKALEDYRKNRQQATATAQTIDHAKEKLEMAKTKLAIYLEKNKPEPPIDEELEHMRRNAELQGFHHLRD